MSFEEFTKEYETLTESEKWQVYYFILGLKEAE